MRLDELIPPYTKGEKGKLKALADDLGVPLSTLQYWRDTGAKATLRGKKVVKIEKLKVLWQADEPRN